MSIKVGSNLFPEIPETSHGHKTYTKVINSNSFEITVYECKLKCGEIEISGVCSSRLVSDNTHGSYGFIDDANMMEECVKEYCKEKDLTILDICNHIPNVRVTIRKK